MWTTVGAGAAIVSAYSPMAHDRWAADNGPTFQVKPYQPVDANADGWGLQRICDPVLLAAGEPKRGLVIDTVAAHDNQTTALLEYTVPVDQQNSGLPALYNAANQAVDATIVLSAVEPRRRRVTLAVTPAGSQPIDGWFTLSWSGAANSHPQQGIFLALRPPNEDTRDVVTAIEWVARLSGGAALPQAEFAPALPASIPLAWLGATLLPIGIILLLSPLARAWSPLPRWARHAAQLINEPDSDADLEAAIDASGLEMGSPVAQRPAGRVLQIRSFRPGDSPAAARKNDWGYFLEDVVALLGSPLMPKVIETPRPEPLSVLTLLDLHPGATARDVGTYADRVRAMTRVAMVNAFIAARRSGQHTLLSLRSPASRDDDDAVAAPDQVPAAIARLATRAAKPAASTAAVANADSRAGSEAALPELLPGEAVVLVTDPGSDIDTLLTSLTRKCVEDRCPLVVVFLVHPKQLHERGLMRIPGRLALIDRSDVDPASVDAFFQSRAEHLATLLSIADARVTTIRTDQPAAEVVSILSEDIWAQV
jgi:hypothetical protein